MNGNEYQELATRTIRLDLTWTQLRQHALYGIAGEVGEIHSIFQKNFQGHKINKDHLKKEIGDLMWFIAELCTIMDIMLDDVMEENIEKLKKRYPDGFEVERSLVRDANDI